MIEREDTVGRLGREVMRTTLPHRSLAAPGQSQVLHLLVLDLWLCLEDNSAWGKWDLGEDIHVMHGKKLTSKPSSSVALACSHHPP